jgi:Bifunctional DNA primase/polymerase, N-terminal
MRSPVVAQASRLLKLGWVLAPVKSGTKGPHHRLNRVTFGTTSTSRLRTVDVTVADVEAWMKLDPNCGIAVYTNGPGEPRCIDFDGAPGWPLPTTADLAGLPLGPVMYTPRDCGGFRMFFAPADRDLRNRRHRWGEFPTQALLPPSIHSSGKPYSWAVDPWELGCALPELKPHHFDLIGAATEERRQAPVGGAYHSRTRSRTQVGQSSLPLVRTRSPTQDCRPLDLRSFDRDHEAVRAMARVLGLPLDRDFSCPFHPPDRHHSACLMSGDGDGCWFVWCGHPGALTYTLAEVRAVLAGVQIEQRWNENGKGQRRRVITRSTQACYKLLLLHEASLISPYELTEVVEVPDLSEPEQRVWDGFRLLVGLKWRYSGEPREPVMFTNTFGAPWCSLERHQVGKAVRSLQEHGLMRLVDVRGRSRKWLPAPYQPALSTSLNENPRATLT